MKMKVVLEFTDEEREHAEAAFNGWQYKAALIQVKELLRGTLKYKQMTEEQEDALLKFQSEFFEIIGDLNLE